MKKAISILISAACAAAMLPFGGCKSAAVPEYTADGRITVTAYAGPTVANWSGTSGNVNTVTDEHYSALAEAGFNKVLALHEGLSKESTLGMNVFDAIAKRSEQSEKDAMQCLALAEKYNITYYVRDWAFYGLTVNYPDFTNEEYEKVINRMFSAENPYIRSSAYGGNFCHDEPDIQTMDKIAVQLRAYDNALEKAGVTGKTAFVNLLPCYASANHLDKEGKTSYAEYIDYYMKTLAPMLGYVCYDFYPLTPNRYTKSYIRETYLYNLELVATKAKENGVQLRTFLQSIGEPQYGTRSLTGIGDLRLQAYTELAFGSREIIYYCYTSDSDDPGSGLINKMTGTFKPLYEAAKTMNNEIHAFEAAYTNFAWDGIMTYNGSEYDNQAFGYLESPLESHERIKEFTATKDAIMGTFKDKDGNDAFMIVNYTDPYFDEDNEVTVKFNNAKNILMWREGQKIVVPLKSDGSYTFKLYPGEGRFVIPF